MANVNRIPRGLLAYLDSQTQGENPSSMGEVVAPVLSMEPYYRSNARYQFNAAGNLAFDTLTDLISMQVPNNEIWFLHQASLSINNNTGSTGSYAASISLVPVNSALSDYLAIVSSGTVSVASTQWMRIPYIGQMIVVPPGATIRGHLDRIAAAGVGTSGYMTILYNAMQI